MHTHEKFRFQSLEDLKQAISELNLDIPLSENISILKQGYKIGNKEIPNRMAIHPMEGCDGTIKGDPAELTFRRYNRFARGGAGILWFEATAVVPEGRANPRQLYISRENVHMFQKLLDESLEEGKVVFGESYQPYTVLQLTHSGRYSKPIQEFSPIIAVENPYLDYKLPQNYQVITDEELERLEDAFVEAAVMAKEIGFDAVDIKACHRYLVSELLSAHTREGKYGGSFENRTRFILNVVDKIQSKLGDSIDITLRMNVYDAIPYPYGWGVHKEDHKRFDTQEPINLIEILRDKGIKLVNISVGNPYYNPHVGRPYDVGPYLPAEHPLKAVERMLMVAQKIQTKLPDIAIIATGFSWLREWGAHVAAGGIEKGWFRIAGFGRQAFAYPDFARDIMEKDKMDGKKCCIACSKCTEIMRDGGMTGCVIRDASVYGPIYQEGRTGKPLLTGNHVAEHV